MHFFFFIISLLFSIVTNAQENFDVRTYGNKEAIKIYLFTSLACPHCAQFHQDVLPEIQNRYLKNQKAQLVVVDLSMNRANLMGATLLRCLPKDQVPVVEKQLYEHQKKWCYDEKDAYSYLSQLAQENGLDAGNFESCIRNKDIQKNLLSTQEKLSERYGVSRMPTLLIRRGKKVGLWEGADKKEIVDGLDEFLDLHH